MSAGSSPGGTSRSTTLSSVAPRIPGLAIASLTLHAPRSTANTRLAISVLPQVDPRALRRGRLPCVLRDDLRVPHTRHRGANRREQRLVVRAPRIALDLAPRAHAIRAARSGGGHLLQLRLVELELELVGSGESGDAGVHRRVRRAAGELVRTATRERAERGRRILHVRDELVDGADALTELLRACNERRERDQPLLTWLYRILRILRREQQHRGDQLRVR